MVPLRRFAPPATRRPALAALCGVLFLTFLDTTVVAVALANVQSDLHAGVTALQWVVNGYALSFASLMLGAGALADRLGRRRMMLAGLGVFALGSALGAAAPNVSVLIGARVIMGIGAAAAEPGTLSIIRQLYADPGDRARALGYWAAICGLALAIGPVVGGVLTGIWSWRLVFIVNLVLCALAASAAHRYVPETVGDSNGRLDVGGIGLVSLSLCAVTFAVIVGETAGYANAGIAALFLVAIGAMALFIRHEHRETEPMLDLSYFRQGAYSSALVVAFVLFFGIFAIFFFTALYLQSVVGLSPFATAGEFAPMAATLIVGSLGAGMLVGSLGPRIPILVGGVLAGGGILASDAVLVAGSHPSAWLYVTLALAGSGFGLALVPVTTVTLSVVPGRHSSMAASTTNTFRELGAVFGVAVLGSLVNGHLTTDLAHRLHGLGVPSAFQAIVISAIEKGEVAPSNTSAERAYGPIVNRVISAAYAAFRDGLEASLLLAGSLILVATVVTAAALRGRAGRAVGPLD